MPTYTTLTWDAPADRKYEYGVSKGVLYPIQSDGTYSVGVPWNGLTNVTDSPSGADNTKFYADNIEYAALRSVEEYGCNIEAYTYPDEFAACDGSASPLPGMELRQQTRKKFGLCWRTEIGNAVNDKLGYIIHVAYGLTVSPSEDGHDTVNDNPDISQLSWDAEGTPVNVTGYKPTCKLEFDSTKLSEARMTALEAILYGDGTTQNASLPLPDSLISSLSAITTTTNP